MPNLDWISFISYVVATNYTPGPNNLSTAAMASRWGLRRIWGCIAGVAVGFSLVMTLWGALAGIFTAVPSWFVPAMGWVGGAYILWLAWVTLG